MCITAYKSSFQVCCRFTLVRQLLTNLHYQTLRPPLPTARAAAVAGAAAAATTTRACRATSSGPTPTQAPASLCHTRQHIPSACQPVAGRLPRPQPPVVSLPHPATGASRTRWESATRLRPCPGPSPNRSELYLTTRHSVLPRMVFLPTGVLAVPGYIQTPLMM